MISREITYTLLSDGSSDTALMPIIEWTLLQIRPTLLVQGVRADLTQLKLPPKDLVSRIESTLRLYPCNVLFIHRDSEKETHTNRKNEINSGISLISTKYRNIPVIPIIPVRMMEAWLLIDEKAIKIAAGNPNGRYNPDIPHIKQIEKLPDPKEILRNHLRQASGLKGRQLDKFNVGRTVHLVAENIDNFSVLKELEAYKLFEAETLSILDDFFPENP